jgi:EAL domain-containing protein (putative c-di-GMP-specific phosphodiesterase class I)
VSEQDTVGRLGGDEFIVLIEPNPGNVPPELIAERLVEVLRQPMELEQSGQLIASGASIGLALGRGESVDELLREADLALYEAKRSGRGRFVHFKDGMQDGAKDRMELEADLQQALEQEQFFLLYQPTFDLNRQQTVGVEALIRWRHPTRGVIGPEVFIPIAEETGLIVRIGRWVLAQACAQLAAWRRDGHDIGMSVNVSAHQLDQPGLEDDVRRVLIETGIPASALTLEITETALMRDVDAATARLGTLKQLGVRLAIDDFGTGHSSLAYLRRFPVDALKIDRSFIAGLGSSKASTAIIQTLVQLGKTLEIATLAEGIEQTAQLEQLQREGCDLGQGYLYARPLEVADVERFLASAQLASAPVPS